MKFNRFTIITILLTLILAALIGRYIIWSIWNNIQSTQTEIVRLNDERIKKEDENRSLRSLSNRENEINQYADQASALIPTEPELADFLMEMESFLPSVGLPNTQFQLPGIAKTSSKGIKTKTLLGGTKPSQFTLSGDAPLNQIITLLNRLGSFNRLTEITNLSITYAKKDSLNFQITGNIFSKSGTPSSYPISESNTILNQAALHLSNLNKYSQPLDIQKEAGFGRPNPFLPF